jgi:Spy/CpxP family protein refolding chaperone
MKKILTILVLTLASSFAVFAQDAKPGETQGPSQAEGRGLREGRMGGRREMRKRFMLSRAMHALGKLNLSDAQREQLRSIHQSAFEGTRAKREELRQLFMGRREGRQLTPEQESRAKQLREELMAARERTHKDVLGVLTPEQRAQLEKLKEERRARREEMRQRREQFREQRRQMRENRDRQPPQQ